MKNLIFIPSLFAIFLTSTIHTMEQTLTYNNSLCTQGAEALVLRNLHIFIQQNQNETLPQTNAITHNVQKYSLPIGTPKPPIKQQPKTQAPALVQEVHNVPSQQTYQLPYMYVTTPNMQPYHMLTNTTQLPAQLTKDHIPALTQEITNLGYQINHGVLYLKEQTQAMRPYGYTEAQIQTILSPAKHQMAHMLYYRDLLLQALQTLQLSVPQLQ